MGGWREEGSEVKDGCCPSLMLNTAIGPHYRQTQEGKGKKHDMCKMKGVEYLSEGVRIIKQRERQLISKTYPS